MISYTIYTLQVRSNVDNQPLTGSAIYPYYPPTSQQFKSVVSSNDYVILQNNNDFVGWSVNRSTRPVYETTNGRVIRIKGNVIDFFYIAVEYPFEASEEFNTPLGIVEFKEYLSSDPTTFTPDYIAEILTQFEKDQTVLTTNRTTYEIYTGLDIKQQIINPQPSSNGFRIRTEGFSEKVLYAEDPTSKAKIIPIKLDLTQAKNFIQQLPDENAEYYLIDLGITIVDKLVANSTKEVSTLVQVDDKEILKNIPAGEKIKGLGKVSQLTLKKATVLKDTLAKALVSQITQFGISQIKEIIEGKVDIDKIPKLCPTESKILAIINLRNRMSQQLDKFYNNINNLSTSLSGTSDFVEAINTAFTVLSTSTTTANTLLGLLPVAPGPAVSAINTLKSIEQLIAPTLGRLSKSIGTLTSTIAKIVSILTLIVNLLALLDKLIQNCAEQLGIPYNLINNQFTALNNQLINDLQDSTANINNSYKGFKFELLEDSKSDSKYPKKYAVAKDKYGVVQLKSESSFTPNPSILINELKFIIDRDNLSAE